MKAYEGRLLETEESNEQLSNRGLKVLYRFEALPKIVQVLGFDRNSPGTLLEDSKELLTLIAGVSKPVPLSNRTLGRDQGTVTNAAQNPSNDAEQAPFEDGGFALQGAEKKTLSPVILAVIDSGVAAVTEPIRNQLIGSHNFTKSVNELKWRDHGTAIASLLAGVEKNGLPVQPYAPNSRILSIKIGFSGDSGADEESNNSMLQLAFALDKALASDAKIVNLSFSYFGEVPEEIKILERALIAKGAAKDVIFVAAAGNESLSLDHSSIYPARYDLQNLVVVGNHNRDHLKSMSSNYGDTVDLSALGEFVPLNTVQAGLDFFSGTSFSAPMVSAALAQSMGICPEFNWRKRLKILFASAASSKDNTSRYGRLQTQRFLKVIENSEGCSLVQSTRLQRREAQQLVPSQ